MRTRLLQEEGRPRLEKVILCNRVDSMFFLRSQKVSFVCLCVCVCVCVCVWDMALRRSEYVVESVAVCLRPVSSNSNHLLDPRYNQ